MLQVFKNTRWVDRRSKGQIIILVAFVFVALIVFVGLVVDTGTVLAGYAQLRRVVDAAGVQASNQFREFRPLYDPGDPDGDMFRAAAQVAAAQGFVPPNGHLRVYACTGPGPSVQASPELPGQTGLPPGITAQLCTDPPRKLVRVDGQSDVGLPFLSIIGWRSLTLKATSVAEAAAIDLAIVLDRSSSMTFDGAEKDPVLCSPMQSCYPFEDVRNNAWRLVNKLYFPYDRVTLVSFSRRVLVFDPTQNVFRQITTGELVNTTFMISDKNQAMAALQDNNIFNIDTCVRFHGCYDNDMPGVDYTANTNTGGAIRTATSVLAVQGRRRGSVWMMLLLSDGAPNATDPWGQFTGGFCPPTTWSWGGTYTVPGYDPPNRASSFPFAYPYCRRANVYPGGPPSGDPDMPYNQISRVCLYAPQYPGGPYPKCAAGTTITDTLGLQYDAADYMRDQADYMGSNGIVAFVIGLGKEVADSDRNQSTTWNCTPIPGVQDCSRERNAGERLLRYVADVGNQPNNWLCHSNYWSSGQTELPATQQCGNYWYSATGAGLQAIFDAIANRIFTRLAQ